MIRTCRKSSRVLSKVCIKFFHALHRTRRDRKHPIIFRAEDSTGAATSVWAATSKDLEGKGGRYLEDCGEAAEMDKSKGMYDPGYGPWAYDEVKAKKLWEVSLKSVGLEDEA